MSFPFFGGNQSGNNPGSQRPLYQGSHRPIGASDSSSQDSSLYQHPFANHPNVSGERWIAQIPSQPSVPLAHYQMLEQELAVLRRKNQEYETTIVHQANLLCQTFLVRNHNQDVPHAFTTCSQPQHRFLGAQGHITGVFPSDFSNHTPRFHGLQLPNLTGTIPFPHSSRLGSQPHLMFPNPHIAGQTSYGPSSLDSEGIKRQGDSDGEPESPSKTRYNYAPSQLSSVIAIPPPPKPDLCSSHSDWSVEYNQEVDKILEVNLIRTITDERGLYRMKFSPDGKLLAVVTCDSQVVIIYSIATGTKICQLEDLYVKEDSSVATCDLSFSPDGKYLATCTLYPENIIRVWKIDKRHVRNVLKGHFGVISLDFTPDGRFLISGSADATVRIWNMRDGSSRIFNNYSDGIYSVRVSPDGRHVAAGNTDSEVLIWVLRSGHLVASCKGHCTDFVDSIVFMPNGEGLISGSSTLKYWDISGLTSGQISDGKGCGVADVQQKEDLTFVGHMDAILSVSISPDSKWLVSGSSDSTVRIWDTRTGSQQCILQAHKCGVFSVQFHPAGGHLASGGDGLHIWGIGHPSV